MKRKQGDNDDDNVVVVLSPATKKARLAIDLGGLAEFWSAMLRPHLDMASRAKCRQLSRWHCELDKAFAAPRWMQEFSERYRHLYLYEHMRRELKPYIDILYELPAHAKPQLDTEDAFNATREWEALALSWLDHKSYTLRCRVQVIPEFPDNFISFEWRIERFDHRVCHPSSLDDPPSLRQYFEVLKKDTGHFLDIMRGRIYIS